MAAEITAKDVRKYFAEICAIPHGSGNTKGIQEYLQKFAAAHGLTCVTEPCGTVIIKKAATPGCEGAPAVVLQGHMDMVAVKDPGCGKDLEHEGLDLAITPDGQYLLTTNMQSSAVNAFEIRANGTLQSVGIMAKGGFPGNISILSFDTEE